MSQPPFSRQIQILERVLNVKLLERTSRSVKLTPAGQSFLPEARHILYLLDSAMQLAKRISLGQSGSSKSDLRLWPLALPFSRGWWRAFRKHFRR